MANAFKWVVGLAVVGYVVVTLSLKVLVADRTRKSDPALIEKIGSVMAELDACKATNEQLRAKLTKSAEAETTSPKSPNPVENPNTIPADLP
jgi:hypothetical protein